MSGATYSKADEGMIKLLDKVIKKHHKRLVKDDVQILLLVAYGPVNEDGETIGPALKHHGVPALGIAKIVKLPYRVAGLGDAEIHIDGDWWQQATERERCALLDHELTHIQVKHASVLRKPRKLAAVGDEPANEEPPKSEPVLDSAGRPVLYMRPHDHEHGWFDEVAKRWGPDSQEAQQAQKFIDTTGQVYFGGADWKAVQP